MEQQASLFLWIPNQVNKGGEHDMQELAKPIQIQGLYDTQQLFNSQIVSEDGKVKLVVGDDIKDFIWRHSDAFPHVENEKTETQEGGKLWSVRFHNGVAHEQGELDIVQTYATIDVGKNILRIKGIVLAKMHDQQVICTPFVQLVQEEETRRVLVTPETWFKKVDELKVEDLTALREGAID